MNSLGSYINYRTNFGKYIPDKKIYLPEIDGMRAIAIVSVFLFHIKQGIMPGGFIGVDVFFVISGFLISRLIIDDLDNSRFSYLNFYQRRIARIVPAASLVAVAALGAGYLWYDHQEFSSLGANASAAALSALNVKQLFEGGYFTASPDAQPLLHYWSLGVEEQFYLLFPAMLHLILRTARERRTTVLMILCGFGYVACVMLTRRTPIAAFYLLHTRAWELLAGAILAALWCDGKVQAWRYASVRMATGMVLVALGMIFARSAGFPGWISILPVGGATLMLSAAGSEPRTMLHQLLVSPILKFIGKISFSLYLWHWVIFSFVSYVFFLSSPLFIDTLKVGLSFAGAIATWYLVEIPARTCLNRRDRRLLAFSVFLLVTALVAWTGWRIHDDNYISAPVRSIQTGGLAVNAGKTPAIVLIGDSQAAMYAYDLAQIARGHGFQANLLATAARNELPDEKDTLWPRVANFLQNHHCNVIVLAQAWGSKLGPTGADDLRKSLKLLLMHADHVVLISQIPNSLDTSTRQAIAAGAVRLPVFETAQDNRQRLRSDYILKNMASDRISIMPVADLITNRDGSLRIIAPNGRTVYHDGAHLSSSGENMIHNRLEQFVLRALTSNNR